MSGYVLFQMDAPFLKSLIAGHQFYVDQARKRLLSQFGDIESEADKAAEEWLERSSDRFNPECHDPADFYEAANDAGIEFYGLLSAMRDQTRLSVVAGMFHEWDKQLRGWLVREIQHWHRGDAVELKIWSVDFGQLAGFLENLGWVITCKGFFRNLDACRLVVNVYKHGEGKSLDDLKRKYPEYLRDPFNSSGGAFSDLTHRDHTHLKVSEDQFRAFSDAIVAFWKAAPEKVSESNVEEVPNWLEKAFLKDSTSQKQASNK